MCLNTKDKDTIQYKEGYKTFLKTKAGNEYVDPDVYTLKVADKLTLKSELFPKQIFHMREWVKDKYSKEISTEQINAYTKLEKYQSGFHFFINFYDALKWYELCDSDYGIFKVLVKDITASGDQYITDIHIGKVGVAQEMYIEYECVI